MNASQRLVCPGLIPCDKAQMGGVKQSGQKWPVFPGCQPFGFDEQPREPQASNFDC